MHLTLQQVTGGNAGRREILSPGQSLRIGRTEWADFSVPDDPRISSVHFELRWNGRTARLRDLNSSNGTRVNGQLTTECSLSSGDVIVAGQTEFRVAFSPQPVEPGSRTPADTSVPIPEAVSAIAPALMSDPPVAEDQGDTPPDARLASPIPVTTMPPAATLRDVVPPRPVSGIDDSRRPYSHGLTDPDPRIRRAALMAAAWSRQPWLLDHCRRAAEKPNTAVETELWLLCVLAPPGDLPQILTLGRWTELGPDRLRWLGIFGHPGVIPDLLRAIRSPDPKTMLAAGSAFQRITGIDIESATRVNVPAATGTPTESEDFEDEFEAELGDQAFLPDPRRAVEYWERTRSRLEQGTRWRRGFDVSHFPPADVLEQLDLASRQEVFLRRRHEGGSSRGPIGDQRYLGNTAAGAGGVEG